MLKIQDGQSTYPFGTRFKNRLFVGGLPQDTTAQELAEYFSNFSAVIKAKVISDEYRLPKGCGFVTFQNEDDVRNVTEIDRLFLRNKKINLGPAVKKQAPTPIEQIFTTLSVFLLVLHTRPTTTPALLHMFLQGQVVLLCRLLSGNNLGLINLC